MLKIFHSDVFSGIQAINDNYVDIAITSPPYWGQRDYGFEGQIGNENSYYEYIGKLVTIFRLLRKKLNKKGIFFLNIGDKYISKYGNTPLGMIPYKLAYFMVKDGWILNDIIIWFKPNHMPSSVKNRFTNSYEPVFVFSKSDKNYYQDYIKRNPSYSNVLKINLQPTPYSHVAVYPEKLVKGLINYTFIPRDSIILDPFAGSGTTLKAVLDINNEKKLTYSSILIENHKEYIDIIKKRCLLNNDCIFKLDYVDYTYEVTKDEDYPLLLFENVTNLYGLNKFGLVKVFETIEEFLKILSLFKNKSIKKYLNKDAINILGTKEFDINILYEISLLNHNGWIIRNMIVVENQNKWFPMFMIVDDNKRVKYKFNYKALNLKHKNEAPEKWNETDFINYKVFNNIFSEPQFGFIVDVEEKYPNGFPKYVIVKWNDNSFTRDFVIYSQDIINDNLKLEYSNVGKLKIIEKNIFIKLDRKLKNYQEKHNFSLNNNISSYNGKFKNMVRKNWGASPGARSSMNEDYFSVQRIYDVDQVLVANYLNYKRERLGIKKSQLLNYFPPEYKHTVGHWLRNDFGGSIPLPEDWFRLKKILDLEDNVTNYVCKTALKLQTVKQGEVKLPKDFISFDQVKDLKKVII